MSMKRSKWKFSPARKHRPAEREYFMQKKPDEIPVEETAAEEAVTETAAAEELVTETAAVEELVTETVEIEETETETAAVEELVTETAEIEEPETETAAEEEAVTETAAAEEPETETAAVDEAVVKTEAAEEIAAGERAVKETAAEDTAEEETGETEAAAETEMVSVSEAEEYAAEMKMGPAQPAAAVEIYGEETSAAQELPDYFFDEDDDLPDPAEDKDEDTAGGNGADSSENFADLWTEDIFAEEDLEFEDDLDDLEKELKEEPAVSLYEMGTSGKKRGKKKDGKGKKNKLRKNQKKTVRIGDVILGDGMPKICVPITGRSKDEIVTQAIDTIAVSPDLVEWRVDYLEEAGGKKDIIDILHALRRILKDTPLLFTYRTEGEGGYGRVGWSHYAELLEWAACRPEIDLIDVEAMGLDVDTEGLIRIIHGRGTPVIASVHYCGEMPGKKERKEAIRFLKQSGGDIIKIAVTPQNEEDVLDLMVWTRKQSQKMEQPLITMAMGKIGKVSRVSGRLTGSAVTFGSVGEMSAPGQIPAKELRAILKQM